MIASIIGMTLGLIISLVSFLYLRHWGPNPHPHTDEVAYSKKESLRECVGIVLVIALATLATSFIFFLVALLKT